MTAVEEFLIGKQIAGISPPDGGGKRALTLQFTDGSNAIINIHGRGSDDNSWLCVNCMPGELLGFPVVLRDDLPEIGEIKLGGPLVE